jgi:transcriptional regulator with XRE-family HTH domain
MSRYGARDSRPNLTRVPPIRRAVRSARLLALASVLRDRRLLAGLKQSDVATSLGWAQSAIADVEGGRRRVDVFEFLDYATALGCEPAELLRDIASTERDWPA